MSHWHLVSFPDHNLGMRLMNPTIAMVQVYVNVENSLELLQQPKDGQNYVIAIAEPRGLIPVRGRGGDSWGTTSLFHPNFQREH